MVGLKSIFPEANEIDIKRYTERVECTEKEIVARILEIQDTKQGSITCIVGPMRSGKSSIFMKLKENVLDVDPKISFKCFKPEIDTRDGAIIKSRDYEEGIYASGITNSEQILYQLSSKDKLEKFDLSDISEYKIVFIDEIQFFDDGIYEVLEVLRLAGVHVICAGLNMNYKAEPFEFKRRYEDIRHKIVDSIAKVLKVEESYKRLNIGDVLAISDAIFVLSSFSHNDDGEGSFATHTEYMGDSGRQVVVGDDEYTPVPSDEHRGVLNKVKTYLDKALSK